MSQWFKSISSKVFGLKDERPDLAGMDVDRFCSYVTRSVYG